MLPRQVVEHRLPHVVGEHPAHVEYDGRARHYRFVTPIGALAILFGFWLSFGYDFSGGWLHAKTALVMLLAAYHLYCGHLVKQFAADRNTRSHVFYRWFNEIPVLMLVAIVILVTVKPF